MRARSTWSAAAAAAAALLALPAAAQTGTPAPGVPSLTGVIPGPHGYVRCLTPAVDDAMARALPPSDCSANSTNPTAAYSPANLDVIEIKVVWHIIRQSNGSGNVPDSRINSQMDILNEDFLALAGTPGAQGTNTKIRFILATTDPNGQPSSGINRYSNNTWYNDGGSYWNSIAWDPDVYMNIYTMGAPSGSSGILGYVPFLPQTGGNSVGSASDRVVLLNSTVGRNAPISTYNQGRTCVHEVGHYLGLYHTFDSGCGGSNCYTSGDRICDTNSESAPEYNCPNNSSSCGSSDPVRNYMNYSPDACMTNFTEEQARRMRCTLEFYRPALGGPGGGGPPTTNDDCAGALALAPGTPTAFDTTAATPGGPAWPCASGGAADVWFSYTTSVIEDIEVSTCNDATYDTAIEIFSGSCASLASVTCNDDGSGCSVFTSIAAASGVPAGTDLLIRIGGYQGAVGTGTVTLTSTPSGGGGPGPDECAGAAPLFDGVSQAFDTSSATSSAPAWPCAGSGGSDIWYSYTTALSGSDVTVTTCGSSYDTAVEIFSGSCGSLTSLACNDDACARQSTATATGLSSGTTLLIRVGGYNGLSGAGTVELTESGGGTPGCGSLPDDAFEDNDDCPGAAALSDGFYPGLAVFEADNDYFAVTVPNGGTLDASIVFANANGDMDLYLWDPLVACDTNVVGQGTGTGALAVGFSASDDETITYTNATGASQNLILEVDMFDAGGCNNYDLTVTGIGVSAGPIGSNYCAANANSTGSPGAMSAFGFTSVAANDVTLTASNLPPGQFGIFVTSASSGFIPNPAGSNGNLCLTGSLGRFVSPGQILFIDGTGEASLAIDLTAIPSGAGTVAVVAGDTRYFQAWHRDGVGGGSNFTEGLQISFTN